jgi:hypothetical protein
VRRKRRAKLESRIACALYYAGEHAGYDGDHHKMWVIDQMVRALTGCGLVRKTATGANGMSYSYEGQGESPEYTQFITRHQDWDEGIAP